MAVRFIAVGYNYWTVGVSFFLHIFVGIVFLLKLFFSWAISGNFVFGEWLIGSCQHVLIQEYVRLLNSWCEWNNCSSKSLIFLICYGGLVFGLASDFF